MLHRYQWEVVKGQWIDLFFLGMARKGLGCEFKANLIYIKEFLANHSYIVRPYLIHQ